MIKQGLLKNETVKESGAAVVRGVDQDAVVFWNITEVADSPTLLVTIQEVDPGDELTPVGQVIESTKISGVETGSVALRGVDSPTVLVSWAFSGKGSFGGVYLTAVSKSLSQK